MAMNFGTDILPTTDLGFNLGTSDKRWKLNAEVINGKPVGDPVYYVEGPDTDATAGTWTGTISGVTEYYDGLTVLYVPHVAGKSSATYLNINNLGAVQCYTTNTSALGTHYGAGTPILFTYHNAKWRRADYTTSDTTNICNIYHGGGNYVAHSQLYRYQLLFQMDDNTLTPMNNVSNAAGNTEKTILTNIEFDPFGNIFYYNSTTGVAADHAISGTALYYNINALNLGYSFNITTSVNALTTHHPVFLKVLPQSNGKVKLASATPLVNSLPTANDAFWYIYLGRSVAANTMTLYPFHPVFRHDGTQIVEVTRPRITYTTSAEPANPYKGMIWLKKRPTVSGSSSGDMPNTVHKEVSITLPASTTSYTYSDSWITSSTSCYAHDLATKSLSVSVSWTFNAGSVVFTLSSALSSALTFTFGMLK